MFDDYKESEIEFKNIRKDVTESHDHQALLCTSDENNPKASAIIEKMSSKRQDVSIKSILRTMRRFYCQRIETLTKYNRKERKLNVKHQKLIKSCDEFVQTLDFAGFSYNMSFYLSLFAYSCDMKKILIEKSDKIKEDSKLIKKALSLIELIDSAMNRFSNKILEKLIAIPEISMLIQYFLTEGEALIKNTRDFTECILTLHSKTKYVNYNEGPKASCGDLYISEPFFEMYNMLHL